jgi:DNA mismatch endonuclease (patch repair protein)
LKNYTENHIVVPRFKEENGFYTTKQRSELMSKIKSQNTKPELKLKKALWNLGHRYRKNVRKLPGAPDIVYSRYKLVIFIDGEFWHGYNWIDKKNKIKTNKEFWIPKIERNIQRDRENNQLLSEKGWQVMRFWEHDIAKDFETCINRIVCYMEEFPFKDVV